MRLNQIYGEKEEKNTSCNDVRKPPISFEVYPPKTDNNNKLIEELTQLKKYNPSIISVTYGAGGANRTGSMNLVKDVVKLENIEAMPHFTCTCSNKEFISEYLQEIEALGIKNILALRGDPPKGVNDYCQDFKYANELVEYIKERTNLSVAVAGYPQVHPDAKNAKSDIINLKKKIDAGAEAIYTQLFFENKYFLDYRENVQKSGINTPIIAGILPITSYAQVAKMTSMCNATIPQPLVKKLEKYKDDI